MSAPFDARPIRVHKPSRLRYFAHNLLELCQPRAWLEGRGRDLLSRAHDLPAQELEERVGYYFRFEGTFDLGPQADSLPLSALRRQRNYWFDLARLLRRMPSGLRVERYFGDRTDPPPRPTLVKARRIGESERTSVLLKLNRVRHYVRVDDEVPWSAKRATAVWRGNSRNPARVKLLEDWQRDARCELGATDERPQTAHLRRSRLSIAEQLRHRFVLSIEGNDVATNLKWILSSNSLCLMPRPTKETWFMEGRLQPGVHYVELAPDLSDLGATIERWNDDPAGAQRILAAAQAWCRQFDDDEREDLLALLVLQRYFEASGQLR